MSMTTSRSPAALSRHDLSARQAIAFACAAMAGVAILDVIADGKLGIVFSTGFVLIAVTTPLSVDVRSLFAPGILPPLLMIATILMFVIVAPSAIPSDGLAASAGTIERLIAGIIDQATALVIGHLLALGVIGLRIITAPDEA